MEVKKGLGPLEVVVEGLEQLEGVVEVLAQTEVMEGMGQLEL